MGLRKPSFVQPALNGQRQRLEAAYGRCFQLQAQLHKQDARVEYLTEQLSKARTKAGSIRREATTGSHGPSRYDGWVGDTKAAVEQFHDNQVAVLYEARRGARHDSRGQARYRKRLAEQFGPPVDLSAHSSVAPPTPTPPPAAGRLAGTWPRPARQVTHSSVPMAAPSVQPADDEAASSPRPGLYVRAQPHLIARALLQPSQPPPPPDESARMNLSTSAAVQATALLASPTPPPTPPQHQRTHTARPHSAQYAQQRRLPVRPASAQARAGGAPQIAPVASLPPPFSPSSRGELRAGSRGESHAQLRRLPAHIDAERRGAAESMALGSPRAELSRGSPEAVSTADELQHQARQQQLAQHPWIRHQPSRRQLEFARQALQSQHLQASPQAITSPRNINGSGSDAAASGLASRPASAFPRSTAAGGGAAAAAAAAATGMSAGEQQAHWMTEYHSAFGAGAGGRGAASRAAARPASALAKVGAAAHEHAAPPARPLRHSNRVPPAAAALEDSAGAFDYRQLYVSGERFVSYAPETSPLRAVRHGVRPLSLITGPDPPLAPGEEAHGESADAAAIRARHGDVTLTGDHGPQMRRFMERATARAAAAWG